MAVPDEEPQVNEIRNGVTNEAPTRPAPVVPTYVGTTAGKAERTNGFPDALQPLAAALAAAGLGAVAWDIKKFTDWERIRLQVERLGVDQMVRSAANAAHSRGEPDSVTAWIGRWEKLHPEPRTSTGGRPQLRSVPGTGGPNRPHPATGAGAPQPTTEDYLNARPF